MIKKHVIQKVGGYRRVFKRAQDLDLWLRLAESVNENSIYNIQKRYHYYRQDGGQLLHETIGNDIFGDVAREAARLRQSGQDDSPALKKLTIADKRSPKHQSEDVQEAYEYYSQFRQYLIAEKYFTALKSLAEKKPNITSIRIIARLFIRDIKLKFR
jgi:hypothetical protein